MMRTYIKQFLVFNENVIQNICRVFRERKQEKKDQVLETKTTSEKVADVLMNFFFFVFSKKNIHSFYHKLLSKATKLI